MFSYSSRAFLPFCSLPFLVNQSRCASTVNFHAHHYLFYSPFHHRVVTTSFVYSQNGHKKSRNIDPSVFPWHPPNSSISQLKQASMQKRNLARSTHVPPPTLKQSLRLEKGKLRTEKEKKFGRWSEDRLPRPRNFRVQTRYVVQLCLRNCSWKRKRRSSFQVYAATTIQSTTFNANLAVPRFTPNRPEKKREVPHTYLVAAALSQ